MDLEKPSHQKQSETLQQALSVLKDHKKWMSQKKGSVAPSQSQQTAARKNFSDEMEKLLLENPPSRGASGGSRAASDKPKKRKKGSVTPAKKKNSQSTATEDSITPLSEKKTEQSKTPTKSRKTPKSSRVLAVTPAPQSLQADLLDTTDTTLLKTEKYGRLAELNFQTLVEQQKDSPNFQELKLALASIRGDMDPRTLREASLKDVLPLISDKATREAYLRYVASLNVEEDKEDHGSNRSKETPSVVEGEDQEEKQRDHRFLNVASNDKTRESKENVMLVSHASSSEGSDEEDTVFSRIPVKGSRDETPPMSNSSSMKTQTREEAGSLTPQHFVVKSDHKRDKKDLSGSSKFLTSSKITESMDSLQSPKYISVSSSSLDAGHASNVNDRDSPHILSVSPLENDSRRVKHNSSVPQTSGLSTPTSSTTALSVGNYPERIRVASKEGRTTHTVSPESLVGLDDVESVEDVTKEELDPSSTSGREVNHKESSKSRKPTSSDLMSPPLFSAGHTSMVLKGFPRKLVVPGDANEPSTHDHGGEEKVEDRSRRKGGRGGHVSRKPGSSGVSGSTGHSSSLLKDYPHKVNVSGYSSEENIGEERIEDSFRSDHSELRKKAKQHSKGGKQQLLEAGKDLTSSSGHSSSLSKDFPRKINITGTNHDGSEEDETEQFVGTGRREGNGSKKGDGNVSGEGTIYIRNSSDVKNADVLQEPTSAITNSHGYRDYPHELSVRGLNDDEPIHGSIATIDTHSNQLHHDDNAHTTTDGSLVSSTPVHSEQLHLVRGRLDSELNASPIIAGSRDTDPHTAAPGEGGRVSGGQLGGTDKDGHFYGSDEGTSEEDSSGKEELTLKKKEKKVSMDKKQSKGSPLPALVPLVDAKGKAIKFPLTASKNVFGRKTKVHPVDETKMWSLSANGETPTTDSTSADAKKSKKQVDKKEKKKKKLLGGASVFPLGAQNETNSTDGPTARSSFPEVPVTAGSDNRQESTSAVFVHGIHGQDGGQVRRGGDVVSDVSREEGRGGDDISLMKTRFSSSSREQQHHTNQSGASTHQPGDTTHQPGDTTNRPGASTYQSGHPSHQPGASTHQPGASTHQHGASTHQHGASTHQPGHPSHQPGASTQQPGHPSHQPGASTHQTGDLDIQPGHPSLQPGASTHQPGASTHQRGTSTHQPGASTHQPGHPSLQPGASTHQPGASTHQPGASTHQPRASAHQPGASTHQPGASTHQLGASTHQPGASTHQPGASTHQPGTSTHQTRDLDIQPGHPSLQPGASTHRPEDLAHQPRDTTNQPGHPSHQPGASAHQPGASTHHPGASTHQPGASIHQPGVFSTNGLLSGDVFLDRSSDKTETSGDGEFSNQTTLSPLGSAGNSREGGGRRKNKKSKKTSIEANVSEEQHNSPSSPLTPSTPNVNGAYPTPTQEQSGNGRTNSGSVPTGVTSSKLASSFVLSEPLCQSTPRAEPKLTSEWRNLAILKMLMSGRRKHPPPPYPKGREGKSLGPSCPVYGTMQPTNTEIVKDQLQWVKNRQQTAQQDQSGNGGPDGTNHTNVTDGNHQDGSCDINHDRPTINDHQETTDGGIRTSGQSSNLRDSAGEEGNQRRGVESGQLDLEEERPVRHPFGETTPLHTAARMGNMKRVKALLRQGHVIDAPDHNGWSPLMCCIHKEGVHLACADLLMREGANLDHQANDGSTALHIAGYTGNVSLLELLLMNGANPVIKDDFGRLPLHWSTKPDSPKSLKLLLGKDSFIDVDAMDNSGMTCLMWAAFNNSPEAIKVLLDRGAEVEEKDIDGLTTIHWAIHKDNADCLRLLLTKERTFYKDKRGCTILHRAAEYGAIKACKLIVELRADAIYDCDKKGRTPLHWAAVSSRVDVCAYLLEQGVDASIRDCHDMTALDYARERGYDYVVALMVCDETARLDFAKATRTTSMVSRLNQAAPESIDAIGTTSTTGDDSEETSLSSLVRSPSINSLVPVGSLTTAKPGQPLQGYLGMFTEYGRGPYDRRYFWIDESIHSLCWAASEKQQKNFESKRVLSVQPGPSQSVRCRLDYSPLDIHKHTFRVVFDETSVFDLVAFEEKSYLLWLRELGSLAVDTFVSRPLGQPEFSDGTFSNIRAVTEDFEV